MQIKTKSIHSAKHTSPFSRTDKEPKRPDPEVLETKPRRRFTAQYKLSILLVHIDAHDMAYDWAKKKHFEVHGAHHIGCWVHARRKFVDVIKAQGKKPQEWVLH